MYNFKDWILNEAYDRETTDISRAVIEALKTHWETISKGHTVNFGAGPRGEELARQIDGIPVSMQQEFDKFVKEDNPVKSIVVSAKSHTGRITQHGSHVQGGWDGWNIHLTVRLGRFDNSVFDELIVNLKKTIRHELEHHRQDLSYRQFEPTIELSKNKNYLDPEKYLAYLTHTKEAEANVVGIVKQAKMTKQPFANVLEEWLNRKVRLRMMDLGHKENDIERIITAARQAYLSEFQRRYGRDPSNVFKRDRNDQDNIGQQVGSRGTTANYR